MKKRLLHRFYPCATAPFLYFSSLSSSSYCITGALQGFLQPSYRWQAASSAHLLLRPSLLLLLLLLRRQLFCFRLWQVPWWRLSILLSWLSAAFQIIEIAVSVATSDSIFPFQRSFLQRRLHNQRWPLQYEPYSCFPWVLP